MAIVQLPLPDGFHTEKILDTITEKDVDGFHIQMEVPFFKP